MSTAVNYRRIRDIIQKPSQALEAMVKGLLKANRRKTFIVDMGTFGSVDTSKRICYGCAATCTLQEICKHRFTNIDIEDWEKRAFALGLNPHEVSEFEIVMDDARRGKLLRLFVFFGFDIPHDCYLRFEVDWFLNDMTWKNEISKVRKTIRLLKAAGY